MTDHLTATNGVYAAGLPGLDAKPVFHRERKHQALLREVAKRREVFARLVRQGRMAADKAEFEIAIMAAIAEDYA